MPVEKCGRNGGKTTTVYTRINISNLTTSFLTSDGVMPLLEVFI